MKNLVNQRGLSHIDAEGNNWFEQQKVEFNKKKDAATEEICKQVGFIK